MRLHEFTAPELILPGLTGADQPTVLRALADAAVARGLLTDGEELYRRLAERESLGSTAIGAGVAVPHCKMAGLERILLLVGIADQPVAYEAPDDQPVRLFFLVVSPENEPAIHLQCLAAISRWVRADRHVERILELADGPSIYQLLLEESG